jgi:hypothetical protein
VPVRFRLKPGAVPQLLKSPEVVAMLDEAARDVVRSAGPGHEHEVEIGATRARAMIWTDTVEARISESRHRTLSRAIDAARR